MNIAIINGPNLNLIGNREEHIYGNESLDSYLDNLKSQFTMHQFHIFQSNVEGEIVNHIQWAGKNCDAIIINSGAFSHYSIAILDALKAFKIKKIEVHISHVFAREEFRKNLLTATACDAVISGFGLKSYLLAIESLK